MKAWLIAPCGMNCGICSWHLGERKCPGCRTGSRVGIKNCSRVHKCPEFKKGKYKYCYQCKSYPCSGITSLDKRYRARYGMSEMANLAFIKEHGIRKFLKAQEKRYKCGACGGVICVHDGKCSSCGRGLVANGETRSKKV